MQGKQYCVTKDNLSKGSLLFPGMGTNSIGLDTSTPLEDVVIPEIIPIFVKLSVNS